jgi:hypothetical protein
MDSQAQKVSIESTMETPQTTSQGDVKPETNVVTEPVSQTEYEKLLKKMDSVLADNKKYRDKFKETEKAQRDAEEKRLAELGEWEKLARSKSDEIENIHKPALDQWKSEAEKYKIIINDELERELSKLSHSDKEIFDKLFPEISDPAEKLKKLWVWREIQPQSQRRPDTGSVASLPNSNLNQDNARRIMLNGSQQEKQAMLRQIGDRMQFSNS